MAAFNVMPFKLYYLCQKYLSTDTFMKNAENWGLGQTKKFVLLGCLGERLGLYIHKIFFQFAKYFLHGGRAILSCVDHHWKCQ